ncbi:hypothetical protein AURDEDRAFT_76544 [Auricularia subglabra TFB-10046 SS5]|uniref:CxC1-like cysteine cluster associated with KDZ transposases domain-containing protein n=1 Tax=Auricularia subglabra (strain TFB-10046 / SS5) TaxID=717982 RepID=J0LC16_AURST|nr:hypothetical protein AURDEDRAFT_76544 [Auricularia subglabra TFB-10046 SS5]
MAAEIVAKRKQGPAKRKKPGAAGQVGDDVLDACEQSFIAAQESVTKASKNYYADTGLMALLCRHDRVLWIANMNTPGERQHFALALLRKLGTELPATWRIGVLYDIGCQVARSIEKWGLLEELADRLIFGVSVFHAYGHQWSCQIVFHPRKRKDFGLSDGEGCERFWSAIRHLIACLRVSGFHRRLFVLNRQIAFMSTVGMWKMGSWLKRRYLDALRRRSEARDLIRHGGVSEDELSQQWEAQVKSHLEKPARQSKKAGDKAIEEILLAMGSVDDLNSQMREDRQELRKAHGLTSTETAEITRRIEVTRAERDATKSRIAALNASLGTEACRRLENMKGSAYLCARVNARALRATIRQGIVMHKFEHRKLERAYRHQVLRRSIRLAAAGRTLTTNDLYLEAKDHSQTKDLVHRREKTLTGQIAKFNALVDQMTLLARQGKKPPRARLPRKLDAKKIFTLDVDDAIWQEDPGLGPQDETTLPRWQTDDAVKRGILALLEYRRCAEEVERVEEEAKALGNWWQEEEKVLFAQCNSDTGKSRDSRCAVND